MPPEKFYTEYSNRLRILEDFTKKFIELNNQKSKLRFILLKKGFDKQTIFFFLNMYRIIDNISIYLNTFIDEEMSKRRNVEDLKKKKEKINEVLNTIYNQIIKMEMYLNQESVYYEEQFKKTYIEILDNIDVFLNLISEINVMVGLFTDKVLLNKSKEKETFEFKVN